MSGIAGIAGIEGIEGMGHDTSVAREPGFRTREGR